MVDSEGGRSEGMREVKNEVKSYFKGSFKESCGSRPIPDGLQFKRLNDLDR